MLSFHSAKLVVTFLPTPSARRATDPVHRVGPLFIISTHALREEGDLTADQYQAVFGISTHALREEGD